MFRRKTRSKPSFLARLSFNRGSDVFRHENTSLIVNESDTDEYCLPKELSSVVSKDGDYKLEFVKSSSLLKSFSQRKQSTPLSQSVSENRVLKEKENVLGQACTSTVSRPKEDFFSDGKEGPFFEEFLIEKESVLSEACTSTVSRSNEGFPNEKDEKEEPFFEQVLKEKESVLSEACTSTVSRPKDFSTEKDEKEEPFFEQVLKAGGAVPLDGNSSFSLSEDQAVFTIKVNNKLKESPENVKKFVNLLKEKVQNPEYLHKMLAHTLTSDHCETARGPVQDPLMRMLLNVECLQADLVHLLLDRIAEFIIQNKAESEIIQSISSILYQMRCLSGMKDIKIASKLFEIIHIATVNVKREIIFLLPEIISGAETEETCTRLIDMLKFDEMLTQVIIDALTNLPLKKVLRSQVTSKVLSRLDKSPVEFLPSLVQFVLKKCETEDLNKIINGLRNNLPFTPQHYQIKRAQQKSKKESSEEDSCIKLAFENLKYAVMASKEMTDAWIKVISNLNSSTDFRCLDLIVLIIFYSSLRGRKNQILQLIRNKIKTSVFNQTLVQNTFKVLLVVAEEYCSSILEIASALFRSFESKISNFGALIYKECFIRYHFYAKKIVLSEILMHVGTGTPATVNAALRVLRELCDDQKEGLSQHTASVMGFLARLPDLDLMQARLLMDVIADIVFCESSNTAAQDELQIFVRKQLMSSRVDHCKKGVTAAVMCGKHCCKEDDCEDANLTEINSLFELAMGSDTKTGFFNDEFATMAKDSRLNKSFLEFWNKKTFALVMDNLFVKNADLEYEDFPVSLQYSLQDDGVQKYVLPVVQFVGKSKDGDPINVPLPVVPSTLRLLWCLEGNLSKTLPMLYAAVIMPESTAYDDFKNFNDFQRKKIMDCLFVCANYFIECINALCARGILDKAVSRLKQLIEVRKLIARFINGIPQYVPPLCQFYASPQKIPVKKKVSERRPRRGRKRKLAEATAETSSSFIQDQEIPVAEPPCSAADDTLRDQTVQEADLSLYSCFFREMDFVTHKLLAKDFKSSPTDDINDLELELGTCDILFLLEDLISKSEQILKPTESTFNFKRNRVVTQKVTPEDFIGASVDLLPRLLNKIEKFDKYTENLLEANDWVHDSRGLLVQGACEVKLAMSAGLKFIAQIVSWQGFQNSKFSKDFLSIIASRKNPRNRDSDTFALDAANYLSTFSEKVLVLSGGLSIVKAFQACLRYSSSKPCHTLAEMCHKFLCRSWFTVTGSPDRGAVYNRNVDFLLKAYFSSVDNKLEVVRATAKTAFSEIGILTEKDSVLNTFKTINKNNFPLLYRTMCEALVTAATSEFSTVGSSNEEQLELWHKIVETMLVFVETAKIQPCRVILASLLKRSQSVIRLFISKGIPLMESALRVKLVEVLTLLKSFQAVTRFLHSVCCQARIDKDSVVAAHVPTIRSLCEKLILHVKGMLIMNGIPRDCITIGTLKNRDIKGNDIISQETVDDNWDDDSELPPEDTPEAEENLNIEAQESYSESY